MGYESVLCECPLQDAVDHLVSISFLSREEIRKAGGVNLFWGLLLQEINLQVGRRRGFWEDVFKIDNARV